MRYLILLSACILPFATIAQTSFKEVTFGYPVHITLPDYMTRTTGLNSDAKYQYANIVKNVYGFVIIDDKEDLDALEMHYSSAKEFYESFMADYSKAINITPPTNIIEKTANGNKYVETEIETYDESLKENYYFHIGVIETPKAYYKVMGYTRVANKDKFKADFQKIMYSLRD